MLWSDDERARLSELWPQHRIPAIAEALQRSRASVRSQIDRSKLNRPYRCLWTTTETEFVESQWPLFSASVIASKIGKTRSAVIGKINRMRRAGGVRLERKPKRMNGQRLNIAPPRPRMEKPIKTKLSPQVRRRNGELGMQCHCQVTELEQVNCRWPYGDPKDSDFYFCGAVSVDGEPYCNTHMREAHHER
jgi:GcrA cell cycle regulator